MVVNGLGELTSSSDIQVKLILFAFTIGLTSRLLPIFKWSWSRLKAILGRFLAELGRLRCGLLALSSISVRTRLQSLDFAGKLSLKVLTRLQRGRSNRFFLLRARKDKCLINELLCNLELLEHSFDLFKLQFLMADELKRGSTPVLDDTRWKRHSLLLSLLLVCHRSRSHR